MKKNLISCTSSDFDFFSEQNTQNMIRDGVMSYVAADLKTEGQVTITVDDSPHYLDLSKAQLYVKIKVYKYNKDDDSSEVKPALKDTDTVSLCNNTLNSLFSQIDLYINDTKVESKMQYGLQSYIQDLLNYNIEAKNTSLQSQGWYNDTAGEMDNITFIRDTTKTNQTFNQGLVNRRLILGNGEVEFLGAPHLDLFTNGKYLINQTKMSLVLTNQSNNYVLIGSGDYKIKILKAGLYIKKLNVNDDLQNAVNIRLEKSFANYEIKATKVITKKINTSGKSESIKICDGIIPKTVILAIGDYEGTVVGKLDRNPFNFYHHNLKSINLQENGGSYPYSGPLILDYEKNDYLVAFKTLETHTKAIFGNAISRSDYSQGFTFYAFDMTPNGECNHISDVDRSGTLSVDIEFTVESSRALALVCYLEYNQTIHLDKFRNVVVEKKAEAK